MEDWLDQLHAARDAGRLWMRDHDAKCQTRGIACYYSTTWNNPYTVAVRGRSLSVYFPSCRSPYSWGHLKSAAVEVCDELGWRLGEEDMKPWSIYEHSHLHGAWHAAVQSTPPILMGGSAGNRPYFRHRDAAARFCSLVPRLPCPVCGKKLPRHRRRAERMHTYLVLDRPYLKIGRSVDVSSRWRRGRSTDNPRPLTLLAELCGDQEGALHDKFSHLNIGGEWFKDVPEIRRAFGMVVEATAVSGCLFEDVVA